MITTRAVLAGAYEGGARRKHDRPEAWLTHSVEVDDTGCDVRVLCGRVSLESICDVREREADGSPLRPTCQRCAKKDPRFPNKST